MTAHQMAVFYDRYAARDAQGNLLESDFADCAKRVANAIADSDEHPDRANHYADLIRRMRFLPGGRVLAGAGVTQEYATYYNCYVLGFRPLDGLNGRDSRDGIMSTFTRMIEILARGGGIGINWSVLRPSGSMIQGVRGVSTGPVAWMRGADALADQIRQGGSRTGALMFLLEDWHPDLPEFAQAQLFARANFSIGVSDAFMEQLCAPVPGNWLMEFPDHRDQDYRDIWEGDLIGWKALGKSLAVSREVPIHGLWQSVCKRAWEIGSPGVVFVDRARREDNAGYLDRVLGVNPCGEQPLPEDGCCNLGAINLVAHVRDGAIDHTALAGTIHQAVRFLDDVIDRNVSIDAHITRKQRVQRRIGLGTMGLADTLMLCGHRYGSIESLEFANRLYRSIANEAYIASASLASQRGVAPGYDLDAFLAAPFPMRLMPETRDFIAKNGIRNLAILTQAPTGTTSALAGVSSGIEPIFRREYVRRDATGTHRIRHPLADALAHLFVTADELHVDDHLAMQAVVQEWVDSAVSKTVNMPESTTPDDIGGVYRAAYAKGLKGISVFRDGCMAGVLDGKCADGECALPGA